MRISLTDQQSVPGATRDNRSIELLRTIIRRAVLILLVGAAILVAMPSFPMAKEINSKAGTSAFPFLKINVGARAVSMGGAFTGLADDASSLYYNPAGVASLYESRYVLGYHNYFDDMQSGFVGLALQLGDKSAIGTYVSYLNYGEFIETNAAGEILGTFGGSDLVWALGFATRPSYHWMIGIMPKIIYEKVQTYSASGIAVDLGVKYASNRERFTAGFAIQNLGSQLDGLGSEKETLPLTFRGGISGRPRGLPLVLVSDLILPTDNDLVIAVGGEYQNFRPVLLRMGWNSFGSNFRIDDSSDKIAGFAFGVGFEKRTLKISYSFAAGADLGNSHRITVSGQL